MNDFYGSPNELQRTLEVSLQMSAETILELLPESPERDLAVLHLKEVGRVVMAGVKRLLMG